MAKALVLALVGAMALGALATTATGSKPHIGADVSIENTAVGSYSGKVKGDKPKKCQKRRSVTVIHDDDNNGVDDDDFRIGTARTDRKGKYSLTGEEQAPKGDAVIAQVEKKTTSRQICDETEGKTTSKFDPPGVG